MSPQHLNWPRTRRARTAAGRQSPGCTKSPRTRSTPAEKDTPVEERCSPQRQHFQSPTWPACRRSRWPTAVMVSMKKHRALGEMQVWDTAGQERFRTITQSYYRSAHGAMITYDITRRATFESVSDWIQEVELYGAANVVLVLIGNKCDLEEEREVLFEEACGLANARGALAALETSAKEGQNVEESFMLMARELLSRNGLQVQQNELESFGRPQLLLRTNSRPVNGMGAFTSADKKSCC
ncbi:ras-related protein Rab-19-like isoform X2 [Festucalex cinctus]